MRRPRGGRPGEFSGVSLLSGRLCFPFPPLFFRQGPCPRGRSQGGFNIQTATQTSHPTPPPPHPHINAIHFLFSHTLLVMVQRGNWFPLPAGIDGRACICITRRGMKMICAKLKWLGAGVKGEVGGCWGEGVVWRICS